MDTTEKYIEMMRLAPEIHKQWNQYDANVGDFYARHSPYFDMWEFSVFTRIDTEELSIWLPRQDQLQNMCSILLNSNRNKELSDIVYIMSGLDSWRHGGDSYKYAQTFQSREQLWLAFTMHLLYQKRWAGTEWVSE